MKKIVSVVLALLCCFFLTSCTNPSLSTQSSEAIAQPVHVQTLHLKGTIVFENLEGGFYTLNSDDGKLYMPLNLGEKYKKDGLKVKVDAIVAEEMMGMQMRGQMITIQSITLL